MNTHHKKSTSQSNMPDYLESPIKLGGRHNRVASNNLLESSLASMATKVALNTSIDMTEKDLWAEDDTITNQQQFD